MPLGETGLPTIEAPSFNISDTQRKYRNFTYTTTQQGLTADVHCQAEDTTPITREIIQRIPVANGPQNGSMIEQIFTAKCPE